ncbi:MAG TPA: VWA domain-containing protein [Vicinamibacterales bacterium]|nr:VWA domain-containing protein [Vicinamibacterales bacterium]
MIRRFLAAGAAAAALTAAAVVATPAQTAPPQTRRPADQVFRAAVEMVSLNVTVLDQQGRYLTDLEAADFLVYEDGAKQTISYFNRTTLPIALSLLIDTSASMEQRMGITQDAAIGFAETLRPQDLAQVVDFDTRVEVLQDFTSDTAALAKAIRATTAGGSTSMHNALYISLKELAKIKPKTEDDVRRRAVVLLSDGEDTSSLVTFEEVLDLAKRSATTIYTIGLQSKAAGSSKGFREAEFVLRQLAQETGGRSFFPQRAEDLAGVYGVIADELASQYTLGYASTNQKRDGGWRRLNVQVDRQGTTARTKRGYFAPVS